VPGGQQVEWQSLGVDGLPGVHGPDGNDADSHKGGGDAEDADVRLDLVDALYDLGLLALAVGIDVGARSG
jgi:hypothetical protein